MEPIPGYNATFRYLEEKLPSLVVDKDMSTEELSSIVQDVVRNIGVSIHYGATIEQIKKVPGYEKFEQIRLILTTRREEERNVEAENFRKAQEGWVADEEASHKLADELVIPDDILKEVKNCASILTTEFDDYKKWKNALDWLNEKSKENLLYQIAYLEILGKKEEAFRVRVEYVKLIP